MSAHRLCEIGALVAFVLATIGVPAGVNWTGLGLVFAALAWWFVP